ncbi:MAG: hypothetical protein HBSAPP03_13370 [Phycisphaerae bacterium]|nr:MAG: hypothetical protein HBSAPP03_13370 [Phycisphaerae bacterium]
MRFATWTIVVGLLGATFTGVASGQIHVALVAAAGTPQANDVIAKLTATGNYASVTYINAQTVTPTLEQLQGYNAVLCWSNNTFQNAEALGDVLADYTDWGGGVVVAVFATSTTTVGRSLGGRFRSGGYEIIPTQSGNTGGAASLGTILLPNHPTMNDVGTLIGGTTASRPTTTAVTSHGYKVALWSDGKTLVAASNLYPNRIDLGMYPPSRDGVSTSWDPATDGAIILANAINATLPPPPPPCDADINCDGAVNGIDVEVQELAVGGEMTDYCLPDADFNQDGAVNGTDVEAVELVVGGEPCP